VEDDALVFVHDAARPALTKALIKRLTAAYREGVDGVVPIVRPVDTVKETHNGLIKKTIQRDRLALVQTPQVFVASTLKRAYQAAEEEFTDDASAVEAAGGRVAIVQGERLNIKVTTREDLLILESIGRQICQN
jgi:2-C-methyl-D-erythritol 4-phosphate cytidylyltransferase